MPTADYRCTGCDKVVTLELPQPETVTRYCCLRVPDVSGECTDPEPIEHRRLWTPVSIGAVHGAGGSPAR